MFAYKVDLFVTAHPESSLLAPTLPMPGRGPRADPVPGFQQGLVLNFHSEDNHPGSHGEIGSLGPESRKLSQKVLGGIWESAF